MNPSWVPYTSALSGIFLFVLGLGALWVFARSTAARLWATSWMLSALATFYSIAAPILELSWTNDTHRLIQTSLTILAALAAAHGYLCWYRAEQRRSWEAALITLLWSSGILVIVRTSQPSSEAAPLWSLVVAFAAVVPLLASTILLASAAYRSSQEATRIQGTGLLFAILLGWFPFAISWILRPIFGGNAWSFGIPFFLVLWAGLTFYRFFSYDKQVVEKETNSFLVEKTHDSVIFLDAEGKIQAVNPAFCTLLGWTEAEVSTKALSLLGFAAPDRQILVQLENLSWSDWEGSLSLSHRNGTPLPLHGIYRRVYNPDRQAVGAVILIYDLRRPYRLDTQTHEDQITSLANRRWVLELLETEFLRIKRYGGELSVLWIVLVNFDDIAQHFGNEEADDVLRKMGALLKASLRRTDFCGRIGSQEFLVVLPETPAPRAKLVAEKLTRLISATSFETDTATMGVVINIGIAALDETVISREDFLNRAQKNALTTMLGPT